MRSRGHNTRFGRLDGLGLGTGQRDTEEEEEYRPSAGDDPWSKLSADMNTMNLERVRQNTKRCAFCGERMEYISLGEYRCPACHRVERDDYGKVRAYIDEHGPSGAPEIEEATGVSREIVDELLRRGKLEIVNGPSGYLRCEICGADIRYGKICAKCARTDGAKMKGYYVEDVGESPYGMRDGGEMRFLKKREERKSTGFQKMGKMR